MILSSKMTGSFYDSNMGGLIPSDAIEVSAELHQELLSGQSELVMIDFDTVPPSLVARPPMTAEQRFEIERAWRDRELVKTDSLVTRHRDEQESGLATTLTAEQYTALQLYRGELRGWPESAGFPDSIFRPVRPSWLIG